MEQKDDLLEFSEDLAQEVLRRAELADEESFYSEAFAASILDYLAEEGEIEDAEIAYYRARGVEISGYSADEEEGRLDLFLAIYTGAVPPETVPRDRVNVAFNRLKGFLRGAIDGLYRSLEESSPVFDMALRVHEMKSQVGQVRLFVFTDGLTTVSDIAPETVDGIHISSHLWDIRRLHRLVTSGQAYEEIKIDFDEEFGAIPACLPATHSSADYDAYLVLIPGEVLCGIYDRFGPRLLERNVRSFLQARTKVNRGIRDTIRNEPQRFLAYNNGITATAESVEFARLKEGGTGIKRVVGLQIVNGGQTTASLYAAKTRDRSDISETSIQAKLVVVSPERMNEIVPLISRFANNQNAIQEADFSANDPFHVKIEEFSRTVWAPAVDGTQLQTRWFYERARGQYNDAKGRQPTPARRREFQKVHPSSQKFTKTDLAKFENTWRQRPYIVSRGAQKNFAEFTLDLKNRGKFEVDLIYFQRLVAKAILFRQAEKIVSAQKFGGYRANIVTYTLSLLYHVSEQRIDLDRIWREQKLSNSLRDLIAETSHRIHSIITNPPGGRNVTEWCKSEGCWKRLLESVEITLPGEVTAELIKGRGDSNGSADSSIDGLNETDKENIALVMGITDETWFGLASWAKQTNNLQGWQRGIAFSLGRIANQRKEPSRKQAAQGVKILEEARALGFKVAVN